MKALVVFVDWFKQLLFEPVLEADPSAQLDEDGNELVDFDARDLWRDECASRNDSRHEARAVTRFPTLAMHTRTPLIATPLIYCHFFVCVYLSILELLH
jgi:hypothetical protein